VSAPIRVLVVDDSAFARKVVREMLHEPEMLVVGIARDGLEALEQIAALKPDVITLDLMMPNLDGLGVLRALPQEDPPRVVVVSISSEESELGVAALQAGAVTIVQKPTALATELEDELRRAVIAAAAARTRPARAVHAASVPLPAHALDCELVAIGTSTGGPQAITELLAALPENFPVPIAIALHIPAGYTEELAQRLDRSSKIDVVEATDGVVLRPGLAVLARGGVHLHLTRSVGKLAARLSPEPRSEPHAPSVDVLFESAVGQLGAAVLGVVLTGMGSDGLRGARAIRSAGGRVLAEAERSCVVYGMPRVIKEAGLCVAEAALEDMALAIARHLGPQPK